MKKEQQNLIAISDELQKDCDLDSYVVPKITVEIPSSFSCHRYDYHEFDNVRASLHHLGLEYNFEQVGFEKQHEAVFYIGPKPTNLINKIKETYN